MLKNEVAIKILTALTVTSLALNVTSPSLFVSRPWLVPIAPLPVNKLVNKLAFTVPKIFWEILLFVLLLHF